MASPHLAERWCCCAVAEDGEIRCTKEQDKENSGLRAGAGTLYRILPGAEWEAHSTKSRGSTARLSHTEFPSSVESFSSLKLVRRAYCGHGMWFVFFTLKGNNTMWPLLWREETKAKKETKATKETKAMKATFVDEEMRDQVLQRVGEEALHRLETTEIPTWVAAERRAQHRACEAERVANRTNEQRQKDKEQHRACEAERVANRTNEQRQKDKEKRAQAARDKHTRSDEQDPQFKVKRAQDERSRVANRTDEQRQKDNEKRAQAARDKRKAANEKKQQEIGKDCFEGGQREAAGFRRRHDAQVVAPAPAMDEPERELSQEQQAEKDPQYDPDALLELCNDANGHCITWNAEHPPSDAADASEWAEWREAVKEDISRFVVCSPERMEEVYTEATEALNPKRVIQSCASCGVRHFGQFSEWSVGDLPLNLFGYDQAAHARREALGEVELVHLVNGDPHASVQAMNTTADEGEVVQVEVATRRVDLRQVVSSYMYEQTRYHLHAPLVTEPADGSPASVMLCSKCNGAALTPMTRTADGEQVLNIPKLSLAAGVDFGTVDVLGLPEPTDIERLLLSDVRMYGEVRKVVAPDEKTRQPEAWQHVHLKGHAIKFIHSGVERVVDAFNYSVETRVTDLLQKVPCAPLPVPSHLRNRIHHTHPQPARTDEGAHLGPSWVARCAP